MVVWTFKEKGYWIYWTQDVEDEAARQKDMMKTTDKVHGCSEGGYT